VRHHRTCKNIGCVVCIAVRRSNQGPQRARAISLFGIDVACEDTLPRDVYTQYMHG
jgi:hypothetical protein